MHAWLSGYQFLLHPDYRYTASDSSSNLEDTNSVPDKAKDSDLAVMHMMCTRTWLKLILLILGVAVPVIGVSSYLLRNERSSSSTEEIAKLWDPFGVTLGATSFGTSSDWIMMFPLTSESCYGHS